MLGFVLVQLEALVEVDDAVLDCAQPREFARAWVAGVTSPHAEEVLVRSAFSFVARVDHAGFAVAAKDRAFEVVRMFAVLLSRSVVSDQDVLNGEPGVHVDDGLVLTFVVHPFVCDDPHEVRVDQQFVQ
nr:hypothetical protein [Rhodococcus sp. 1139]